MRPGPKRPPRGFTLVELGVVIVIIGLMMSFLLAASWEGLKRSQARATQALILKLEQAMADRIEAVSVQRPSANLAHFYLGMTQIGTTYLESPDRARLIAKIDYIRRELPDVFFVQDDPNYPLNFAGVAFHPESAAPITTSGPAVGVTAAAQPYAYHILPIGHALTSPGSYDSTTKMFVTGGTFNWGRGGEVNALDGEGIFGASYSAMAALTRQLGYPKRGHNANDDDGNGLVDEFTASEFGLTSAQFSDLINGYIDGDGNPVVGIAQKLASHTHITARSEMLYAILVAGAGPLGSAFSPDDFTDTEVMDTDGDGLLEFVDAWGKPLQFFRWPFYYVTDPGSALSFQKGSQVYAGYIDPREQQTLDPNQLLMAPGWWASLGPIISGGNLPDNSAQMSSRANLFQQHFFSLVDPYADTTPAATANGLLWDRTGYYKRRAYFSKFLILSAGPDGQYGVGSFGLAYGDSAQTTTTYAFDRTSGTVAPIPSAQRDAFAERMILIENQASQSDPFSRVIPGNAGLAGTLSIDSAGQRGQLGLYQLPVGADPLDTTAIFTGKWMLDDIANQTLNAPGTGAR